jgi:hypothetical protein
MNSHAILLYAAGVKPNAANPMCAICLSDFESREHGPPPSPRCGRREEAAQVPPGTVALREIRK